MYDLTSFGEESKRRSAQRCLTINGWGFCVEKHHGHLQVPRSQTGTISTCSIAGTWHASSASSSTSSSERPITPRLLLFAPNSRGVCFFESGFWTTF